jgi:glycosyltransferase involved in cell wall biosynthesis
MLEEKLPLSVVIITKNEEKNIKDCLESVKWASEIIVLDDYSDDMTVEIAKRYTDKVIQRRMDVEGKHRNYAYSLANNNWILSLDADERVTSELKDEIVALLKDTPEFEGYTIPRRNYIGNYWLRFGGWYPSAQLKLFKKGSFWYEEVGVHPRAIFDKAWGNLNSDIIHYSYQDFSDFLNKLNHQTTLEAKKWVNDKRKMGLLKALWRTIDRFLRSYVRKRGYKDGLMGFIASVFAGMYQILSYAKYLEIKSK